MAEHDSVSLDIRDAVGVVTLNRPDSLNAINSATIDVLGDVLHRVSSDPAIRAVILTGAGRAFCAGADVKEWNAGEADKQEPWPPKMHRVMNYLYWLPKPVIAAVNGVAVGAGCDLTLTADIRVASTNARFGEVYMRLGFCPDAGGSFLLPRIVGESRAAEMIYTGDIIDSEEAARIGLVSEVVQPDELMEAAMRKATKLAQGPTKAIGVAKRNIRRNALLSFSDALMVEEQGGWVCAESQDHREGLAATIEKRRPNFIGS